MPFPPALHTLALSVYFLAEVPDQIRATIRPLLDGIPSLAEGWTLAICSPFATLRTAWLLLVDDCSFSAASIAELLSLPLPADGRLLVLCGDYCCDGGADELMAQVRQKLRSDAVRFVVLLPDDVSDERLAAIWNAGPDAICRCDAVPEGQLFESLVMLLRGHSSVDSVFRRRLQRYRGLQDLEGESLELSGEERELIQSVARGHSSREIAALRDVRSDTARRYLSALYRKVGVKDQRGLLGWALAQGLLRQPDLQASTPVHPGRSAADSRPGSPATGHSGPRPAPADRGRPAATAHVETATSPAGRRRPRAARDGATAPVRP